MIRKIFLFVIFTLIISSCSTDDATDLLDKPFIGDNNEFSIMRLDLRGFFKLEDNTQYQIWLVDFDGNYSKHLSFIGSEGGVYIADLPISLKDKETLSEVVISVENNSTLGSFPSESRLVSANVNNGNNQAAFSTTNSQNSLGTSFPTATGQFKFQTPSTTTNEDEDKGLYFINEFGNPSLNLNTGGQLSDGWVYEGWVEVDGTTNLSLGKFTSATEELSEPRNILDNNDYKGPLNGLTIPGEEFIVGVKNGVNFFNGDFKITKVFITVEPVDDNSENPFHIVPLSLEVNPINGEIDTSIFYNLQQNDLVIPSGAIQF